MYIEHINDEAIYPSFPKVYAHPNTYLDTKYICTFNKKKTVSLQTIHIMYIEHINDEVIYPNYPKFYAHPNTHLDTKYICTFNKKKQYLFKLYILCTLNI